jgi:phenylalanyl-tRNA synthetase alpha subunit
MNYLEQLKDRESNLIQFEAKALAKKQSIEEMMEKRKKAEEEAESQFGISLSEIPKELESSKKELEKLLLELTEEISELENEFSKINC